MRPSLPMSPCASPCHSRDMKGCCMKLREVSLSICHQYHHRRCPLCERIFLALSLFLSLLPRFCVPLYGKGPPPWRRGVVARAWIARRALAGGVPNPAQHAGASLRRLVVGDKAATNSPTTTNTTTITITITPKSGHSIYPPIRRLATTEHCSHTSHTAQRPAWHHDAARPRRASPSA